MPADGSTFSTLRFADPARDFAQAMRRQSAELRAGRVARGFATEAPKSDRVPDYAWDGLQASMQEALRDRLRREDR